MSAHRPPACMHTLPQRKRRFRYGFAEREREWRCTRTPPEAHTHPLLQYLSEHRPPVICTPPLA
eukprot:695855-Rhodomonas_salina.1